MRKIGLYIGLSCCISQVSANTTVLEDVEIIGVTPLQSLGVSSQHIPSNSYEISTETLADESLTPLTDTLQKHLPSVNITSLQGNPYQNDVFYRGFLASPLLGSQIGLSMYVDGVRNNESFGETVNWDSLPKNAISHIGLLAGSNAVFGRNTLGGALSLKTKDGVMFQGTEIEASTGSFSRRNLALQHGGNKGAFDWYIATDFSKEDGWRQYSPSETRQLLGKLGWENDTTRLALSYNYADNDFTGNGASPESLLAKDRTAVYTYPDNTLNTVNALSLQLNHFINDAWSVSGNVYYRHYERQTLNGDAELECVDDDDNALTFVDGESPHPAYCNDNFITQLRQEDTNLLPVDEVELEAEGEERRTFTKSRSYGVNAELSYQGKVADYTTHFTVGMSAGKGKSDYSAEERDGEIIARGLAHHIIGEEGELFESDTQVETQQKYASIYLSNTLSLNEHWDVITAGRYHSTEIEIADRSGEQPKLNGTHRFSRFTPSLGLTYHPTKNATWFVNYSQGFRTPTAAELTCADPDDPCTLPNAFVADPPLDPVRAKTYEIGGRGTIAKNLNWRTALFRTNLKDDILFIQSRSGSRGFFQNVGDTRRQGVELSLSGQVNKTWHWFTHYSYTDATFETDTTLASTVLAAGNQVEKGDKLPSIPAHQFKFGLTHDINAQWRVGFTGHSQSGQFLRGDEANNLAKLAGFSVFDLNARYKFTKNGEVFLNVKNVLDKTYNTAGVYNRSAFSEEVGTPEVFLAPAAGRAAWVGIRFRF